MRIEVRIHRLVLDGVDARRGSAVRAALEQELAARLTADATPSWQDRRNPPRPAAPAPTTPGADLAAAVHDSVRGALGGAG